MIQLRDVTEYFCERSERVMRERGVSGDSSPDERMG